MPRLHLLLPLLALAFVGLADSWYLAESAANDASLACDIRGLSGCNIVAQSPYAHLFGVPLGAYGVMFYALVFVLVAAALTLKHRHIPFLLVVVTALGALASLVFMGLQFFVIKAVCVYCLLSAVVSFFSAWLAFLWRRDELSPAAQVVH